MDDVLIIGGTVRDIFFGAKLDDIDISIKVEMTSEEMIIFSDPRREVTRRIFDHCMDRLRTLSRH
ncbi:hypothetical protein L0P02_13120, partial [Bifidobacterium longum]|nr:hypothetical protein [Bifidobacterium longum]